MLTLTVDIIDDKAIRLLHELELMQLIRVRREKQPLAIDWTDKYKGTMTKQPLQDIDNQLNELRNGWE